MDIMRKEIQKEIDTLRQSIKTQRNNIRSTIMKNKVNFDVFDWERDGDDLANHDFCEYEKTRKIKRPHIHLIGFILFMLVMFITLFLSSNFIKKINSDINQSSPTPIESVQSDQLNKL